MATNDDILVKVENVGKVFCRDFKKSLWYGFKDSAKDLVSWRPKPHRRSLPQNVHSPNSPTASASRLSNVSQFQQTSNASDSKQLRPGEFWAAKDISFELRRGECLGLIGHNGAGKTTLLKMLNGLIKPDLGKIEMRGRIGALIALGAGFNPLLTGRENVYVNGSILGLTTREIDQKLEKIINFAEIQEFIDSPVQTYSSGMNVRLGFAIAANLQPDVLLVDEVLAVGDIKFRNRCLRKIHSMLEMGTSAILVSHNLQQISSICSRALLLTRGSIVYSGETSEAIYRLSKQQQLPLAEEKSPAPKDTCIRITNVTAEGELNTPLKELEPAFLSVTIDNTAHSMNADLAIAFAHAETNLLLFRVTTKESQSTLSLPKGESVIQLLIPSLPLAAGSFVIRASIVDPEIEHGLANYGIAEPCIIYVERSVNYSTFNASQGGQICTPHSWIAKSGCRIATH